MQMGVFEVARTRRAADGSPPRALARGAPVPRSPDQRGERRGESARGREWAAADLLNQRLHAVVPVEQPHGANERREVMVARFSGIANQEDLHARLLARQLLARQPAGL